MATLDTLLTLYFFDMNSLAIIPLLKLCHFQSLSSPKEDGNNAFQSSYNWSFQVISRSGDEIICLLVNKSKKKKT